MKISIIISTYNRTHYLQKTLEGYLNQTYPPNEIIIADDGSTSNTADVIGTISKTTNIPIIHVWHEDKGFRLSKIRNKAIAKSTSDYIILSDDDSVPCIYMVQDHNRYAEEGYFIQGHRVLLAESVSQQFTYKQCDFKSALNMWFRKDAKNITNAMRLPIPIIRKSVSLRGIRSCNMSFFKKDFIAVNGFNEDFEGWGKEDSELVVRFYKYGLKRKDIKFRLYCFHLYHKEYSRDKLQRNIDMFENAKRNDSYYCLNGVDKYLTD
ncbi:MAG: glycosyltransferase family 2 protein [Thermodesulfovibrionales bacterium]|nr:glycosyltransferase family 2 protein [Thermodesulfovibrionales bacterium]